jgi:hypothetical protein
LLLEQLIEDGAVLDHGGAEFFGGGFIAEVPDRDGVRQAVVFDDPRVGDGEIVGALLETGAGIAARFKERIDQVVGFRNGSLGMIDEAGLDDVPFGSEAIMFGEAKVADFEGNDAGFAISQLGFGFV